jgi:hypothetical protein
VTVAGVAVDGNRLHGHDLTVLNDQEYGEVILLPDWLLAPLMLAVYVVPVASAAEGWNVVVKLLSL